LWYSLVEIVTKGEEEICALVTTDASSPWFSGHFPGDPILPGVAQLKMVADIIATQRKERLRMTGLSRIKFRKIVRPGELLTLHVTTGTLPDQYAFRITSGDADVCSGVMLMGWPGNERDQSPLSKRA
jgi:3-hydroxymyristoyl/3-hydroxydecanoyl-(acyl carrier protein) dehydratase